VRDAAASDPTSRAKWDAADRLRRKGQRHLNRFGRHAGRAGTDAAAPAVGSDQVEERNIGQARQRRTGDASSNASTSFAELAVAPLSPAIAARPSRGAPHRYRYCAEPAHDLTCSSRSASACTRSSGRRVGVTHPEFAAIGLAAASATSNSAISCLTSSGCTNDIHLAEQLVGGCAHERSPAFVHVLDVAARVHHAQERRRSPGDFRANGSIFINRCGRSRRRRAFRG